MSHRDMFDRGLILPRKASSSSWRQRTSASIKKGDLVEFDVANVHGGRGKDKKRKAQFIVIIEPVVSAISNDSSFVSKIAKQLKEQNVFLLGEIVKQIGESAAADLVKKTDETQKTGGMELPTQKVPIQKGGGQGSAPTSCYSRKKRTAGG